MAIPKNVSMPSNVSPVVIVSQSVPTMEVFSFLVAQFVNITTMHVILEIQRMRVPPMIQLGVIHLPVQQIMEREEMDQL